MRARLLEANQILLGRGQLYMLPSRFGLYFALLLLVLLMASINYNNGLAFGLTFLLASTAIVSMLYTHYNLCGLQVTAGNTASVFAGQPAIFNVQVLNLKGPDRYGVQIEHNKKLVSRFDIRQNTSETGQLAVPGKTRGYLSIPDFSLSTDFPLGLLYSWSRRIRLSARCLVYPAPAASQALPLSLAETGGENGDDKKGGDDFYGLRPFQLSDSPKHISWKALAKGQGMLTKEFAGARIETVWLDWDRLSDVDTETRLSILCRWVLDAHQQGKLYGLRLPTKSFAPANNHRHRHECLKALALSPPAP